MHHSCVCAIPVGVDGLSVVNVEGPELFDKYIMGYMGAGCGMGCTGIGC